MPSQSQPRRGRPIAAFLAVAAGLGVPAAANAQTVAWAWVTPAGQGATFTPSAAYRYTPSGAPVTVARDPVQQNRFLVTIPDMGSAGGVVHACAYNGNHTAVVNGWGVSGTGVVATVELFTPTGAPANDAPFTIHYRLEGADDRREAYLWANNPTVASYTPSTAYSWNGNRADPTITRSAVGVYQVLLPGLGGSTSGELGHVQVTPYATSLLRAKVSSWGVSGADVLVNVRCFDGAGVPADGRFVLSYNEVAAPIAAAEGSGAHVWANNSTAASYTPAAAYTDSNGRLGPANAETIVRTAVGTYRVELPNVAPSGSSIALATAYGSSSNYASVSSWFSNGSGGSEVVVKTYTAAGASVDSQFTLLYLTNRPAAAQEVAWAWVAPAGAGATFTPSLAYQYTRSGNPITVARDPAQQNRFLVTIPDVAPSSGVVHACAYGGNHTAVVNSWILSGNNVVAAVELFTPTGGPADNAAFTIHYRRDGNNGNREAYLWADNPTSASYTPSPFYSWNGNRPDPTITRSAAGQYQVRIPGLGNSASGEFGHVQVTPYSGSMLRAKVQSWFGSAGDLLVDVRCTDAAGVLTDGRFVLSYNESAAPMAADEGSGAHVWADNSTAASYTPSPAYTDSNGTFGPDNSETVQRLGTGSYRVRLVNVAPLDSSIALVTAYGSSSNYASIQYWAPTGAGGTDVQVNTYTAAGAPIDSQFTLFYLTNRSAIDDPGALHRFVGQSCNSVVLTATPDPVSTPTSGTNLTYRVAGAPPAAGTGTTTLSAVVLSLSGNPGLSLGSLGAPGCFLYVNTLDLVLTGVGSVGVPTDVSWPLPPGVPSGTHLYAQAASFTTLNAFGLVTSNGLDSRIENF